jgi:hypothetical protein
MNGISLFFALVFRFVAHALPVLGRPKKGHWATPVKGAGKGFDV